MSDRERSESVEHDDNGVHVKSDYDAEGSPENGARVGRGRSGSSDRKKSPSRSRSRSRSHRKSRKSRRSRTRSRSRSRSRSHRHSHRGSKRPHHSRSRSRSSERHSSRRSRSRSPMSTRKRHIGPREQPPPTRCLGVFGMSTYTDEKVMSHYFSQFGKIENVQIVYDKKSGRSRGFGFVYFESLEDSIRAKEAATGAEIDGQRIRIDFSITKRPHTPTPGIYMGRPSHRRDDYGGSGGRSPSPYYPRRRQSRSYSYSPRR